MRVYRLTRRRDPAQAFDGTKAAQYPGRWNVAGRQAIYTAASLSLAMLEVAAASMSVLLHDFVYYCVDVDDDAVERLDLRRLESGWWTLCGRDACRRLGEEWRSRGTSAGLIVPSAVLPFALECGEVVVILNPRHPAFAAAVVDGPFALSMREPVAGKAG